MKRAKNFVLLAAARFRGNYGHASWLRDLLDRFEPQLESLTIRRHVSHIDIRRAILVEPFIDLRHDGNFVRLIAIVLREEHDRRSL